MKGWSNVSLFVSINLAIWESVLAISTTEVAAWSAFNLALRNLVWKLLVETKTCPDLVWKESLMIRPAAPVAIKFCVLCMTSPGVFVSNWGSTIVGFKKLVFTVACCSYFESCARVRISFVSSSICAFTAFNNFEWAEGSKSSELTGSETKIPPRYFDIYAT